MLPAFRWLILVGVAIALAVAFAPADWWQPLGAWIRRPEDVTPERIGRLRLGCTILACLLASAWTMIAMAPRHAATFVTALMQPREKHAASLPLEPWTTRLALAMIVAMGLFFRLADLTIPMDYDEAYTFLNFARRPIVEAWADYNNTNNHPLNTLLMAIAFRLGGQSDAVLRLPVVLTGSAMIPLAYLWARRRTWHGWADGPQAARADAIGLVVAALVATSPLLISYSVNARGYVFLANAALVLDLALLGVTLAWQDGPQSPLPSRCWLVAIVATIVGFVSIPIMLYPAVGIWGGFVFYHLVERYRPWPQVIGAVAAAALAVVVCVVMFYLPAFVFRGLQATRNPFVWALSWSEYASATPIAWSNAWADWVEGPVPLGVWVILTLFGVTQARQYNRLAIIGWLAPFVGTVVIMALHRVAPPPRLYLFLAPWYFGLVAVGVVDVVTRWLPRHVGVSLGVIGLIWVGVLYRYADNNPMIYHPRDQYVLWSVPEAVARILHEDDDVSAVVLAPLPLDLPVIYYVAQAGRECRHNVMPTPGATIWILTRPGQSVDSTLNDGVVNLLKLRTDLRAITLVARLTSLDLHRAVYAPRAITE